MPRFEIVGIGRETEKKRVRVYAADNKESAISAASADGTIVELDKIRQIPDIPATESQKQYAKSLEIDFPPDISKINMSRLIDAKLKEYDEIPNEDALSNATTDHMVDELYNRGLGAILITFDEDSDIKNIAGAKLEVAFSDNLTEAEMRSVLFGLGCAAKQ